MTEPAAEAIAGEPISVGAAPTAIERLSSGLVHPWMPLAAAWLLLLVLSAQADPFLGVLVIVAFGGAFLSGLAGTCGTCRACTSGRENLCERAEFTGWDRDGGYAERMTVGADVAVRLPDGFADLDAAPLLCGGVIGYRALRVAGVEPGSRLGLFGFGASALLAIQVARHWGCEVYVFTRSEHERERAVDLGAAWTGGYDDPAPVPLDAAVTFAPVGSVVVAALRAVDRGGTVAINAIHLDRIPELPYELLWWERSLRSVANVTREDARAFLALAAEIPIRTATEVYPLADGGLALERLASGEVRGSAVLAVP